jgi:hypothetical protein
LDAPALAGEEVDNVELVELFRWLRCCVAMVDLGSQFYGELSAGVAARSLIAAVCYLLETSSGGKAIISKTRLWGLRDLTVQWPTPEEVRPEALAALPKNIAKNFMVTFFKEKGRDIVEHEGERMKDQVSKLILSCCLRLFVVSTD